VQSFYRCWLAFCAQDDAIKGDFDTVACISHLPRNVQLLQGFVLPTVFQVAQLFADGAPTELVLPSCTQLEAPAMCRLLEAGCSARLERLELGMCGRGFGDEAASVVSKSFGGLPALHSLVLRGAYRLSDDSVPKMLEVTTALRHLGLPDCSRLTGSVVAALPSLTPRLMSLDLSYARGVDADALPQALPQLAELQRVRLEGIPEVRAVVWWPAGWR